MDISKWLEGTAGSDHLNPTLQVQLPALLRAENEVEYMGSDRHKRRRRARTDSSLIAPNDITVPTAPVTHRRKSESYADETAPDVQTSSSESKSESNGTEPSQRYERRPRRKTRPDRYEPKPDKDKKRKKLSHKEKETSQRHRKSRRKRRDKLRADPGQSFHADNVPQERLTVSLTCLRRPRSCS